MATRQDPTHIVVRGAPPRRRTVRTPAERDGARALLFAAAGLVTAVLIWLTAQQLHLADTTLSSTATAALTVVALLSVLTLVFGLAGFVYGVRAARRVPRGVAGHAAGVSGAWLALASIAAATFPVVVNLLAWLRRS